MDKVLINYVKDVVDLEKSLYTQNRTIEKITNKVNSMGIPANFGQPNRPDHVGIDCDFGSVMSLLGFGALIGGIAGLFLGNIISFAVLGAIGLTLIIVLLDMISAACENARRRKVYKYNVAQYQNAVAQDSQRVQIELSQKYQLDQALRIMINKRNGTADLLAKYYAIGIIYPKYRNMIAMCSIYDYLMAGICSGLTGFDGAYNKYDLDEKLGVIISKLDVVIDKLDQIKNNQYMLYDAIQEGNRISQGILDNAVRQTQLQQGIFQNSAISMEYQRQQTNEMNKMRSIMSYESWARERNR